MEGAGTSPHAVIELTAAPVPRGAWARDLLRHRNVLMSLARADFHVRYKRATLGIAWAVLLPVVQTTVLTVVFSKLIRVSSARDFGAYVLSGMLAWTYFSQTTTLASTAIVDGTGMTDKVWFPRLLLPVVPALSSLVGFGVTLVVLLASLPVLGADVTPRLFLLPVAALLLFAFTVALSACLSALHVYYRDVRFIVQAALSVWFYVTPVAYPVSLLGSFRWLADLNPMTGVVTTFRMATVGAGGDWHRPVLISVVTTVVLLVVGLEGQRRHDRLFVDLL